MGRGRGMEFCCCAVPLVNAGAYFLVLEAAFVSLVVAILALVPPSIVATMGAIPSWSKGLIAALGLITFFWQTLGLFSIIRQSTAMYRTYIRINLILTLITIVSALAFFAVSAVRHSTALDSCVAKFGSTPSGDGSGLAISQATSALDGSGRDICNVFIWVQIGVMGGLIVLMGVTQLYMCYAQRSYGQKQREAARRFKNFNGPGDDIPLAPRDSGVWEPRGDEYYASSRPYHNAGGAAAGGAPLDRDYPASPPMSPHGGQSYYSDERREEERYQDDRYQHDRTESGNRYYAR
ncbi:hypothetical protein IE53DRAFT_383184 [Violaceomyces palustris]|uniref:Uncharacterized protein n=1 Tax=Violaceomyces palustris TaxID=1673888 RepID=A0ACD0P811_9BASI|nr:hypothetical protein IE53DRAFT_383184 [Violaceomyces palustris]